jgi:hypothetical protein
MNQDLLSIYPPDGPMPAPEVLEKISGEVQAVREDMRAAGARVFSGGLHAPSTATVVNLRSDRMPMTDGPYPRALRPTPEAHPHRDRGAQLSRRRRRRRRGGPWAS